MTKRETDGRYAFVEIEHRSTCGSPAPAAEELGELVAKAEAGCFVGNSLSVKPRYRWIVNGEEVS
jgi:organic hydroperoxide reductase OsmC/OhrA